jgi:uncharacterized membrane protein
MVSSFSAMDRLTLSRFTSVRRKSIGQGGNVIMELVRGALLVISTLAVGLQAGLFYTFACSVMRTLRGVDDRTFVNVMQRINRDIQNGWFGLTFAGSLLFTTLALVLFIGVNGSVVLPVAVGLGFYVLSFGITMRLNIPMNIRLDQAGNPNQLAEQALAKARKEFEVPWSKANLGRMFANIASCTSLCWALIVFAG